MEKGFGGVTPEKIFKIYMQNGDIWWILRLIHKDSGKVFSHDLSHIISGVITVDLLQRRESFDFVFFWIARSVAGSVCQIVIFLNAEQWRDISKDTSFSSSIVKVDLVGLMEPIIMWLLMPLISLDLK